jgi:dTDP-4-dehydrorhamnose reductase
MKRVIVLGGSGMLGSMIADYLSRDSDLEVTATARTAELSASCRERLGEVTWQVFDAASPEVLESFYGDAWVINAIGIIKPLIHDDNASEVERAIRVNALFPHWLAQQAEGLGMRVLQIATDCVYSGSNGGYVEADAHDALDVYGKTKSLGEAYSRRLHHLRCSIIGPEPKNPKSLMEWFLGQPREASVNGFVNHNWNGVTTLHFAKLCQGVIKQDVALPHVQHVVPQGAVSKFELLKDFARCFGREDVKIKPTEAATIIDRTLATADEQLNRQLWAAAGYSEVPSVPQMLEELAQFNYRMGAGD